MAENVEDITKNISELTVLSFRKLDDVKKLAKHFTKIINHPITEQSPSIQRYLKNLQETHKRIIFQKRDSVEVEYIFTTEKKSSLQRQRFNSLPVSEVPELLKNEFIAVENARQVHICTDCDVEIELNDEEPLMESLQKHFNLEVHLPKLKRESIDVAEPVILPNMSRRLSALECGEMPVLSLEQLRLRNPVEKLDRNLCSKLTNVLLKVLPDTSEASIAEALKIYQETYDKLCQDVSNIDFTNQTSSVAPIIMSIRDNVYQNFSADANKNTDNDENEQSPEKPKAQTKKYRYYGPIEASIVKLLLNHKLVSLVDDRTGKLAFFCIACEYYTLRFHYDSVLSHVFSETHVHNLSCIMQSDKHIPFLMSETTIESIKEMNAKFLSGHNITATASGLNCRLCKQNIETAEATILHLLDEKHLAMLSDDLYLKMKATSPNGQIPEEWGPKDLSWSKYLASVGKPVNNRDHVIIENFIKPSGKVGNFCTCCDMTLKGPRQVLFNHIRQKKHLRNAAPKKLALLYKNYCRPSEYYASFGNFYICSICPEYVAVPSFANIVEHFESNEHMETVAKLLRLAVNNEVDKQFAALNKIEDLKCVYCNFDFQDNREAVKHALSNVYHQSAVAETKLNANRADIISVYMKGNYILHSEGASFTCVNCNGVFNSIRSLLMHLVHAEHFAYRPPAECTFRYYLELKHNINMLAKNKYVYYSFGRFKCGVCDADIEEGENAKRHVLSPKHRENMGATYINEDASAVE